MDRFRKAIKEAGDAGDKLFTSDEERMKQTTERHSNDMYSDSWLSKNVRPLVFLLTLLMLIGMTVSSGLGVVLETEAWVIIRSTLALEVAFYFGGRSLEKIGNRFFNRDKKEKGAF